jgi:hypothetical protein
MVKGFLLNDDDPCLVDATTGYLHKVEWISGSSLFSRGDFVILTTNYGSDQMISSESEAVAEVWVEDIE